MLVRFELRLKFVLLQNGVHLESRQSSSFPLFTVIFPLARVGFDSAVSSGGVGGEEEWYALEVSSESLVIDQLSIRSSQQFKPRSQMRSSPGQTNALDQLPLRYVIEIWKSAYKMREVLNSSGSGKSKLELLLVLRIIILSSPSSASLPAEEDTLLPLLLVFVLGVFVVVEVDDEPLRLVSVLDSGFRDEDFSSSRRFFDSLLLRLKRCILSSPFLV